MKKNEIAIICVVVSLSLLSACGGGGDDAAPSAVTPAPNTFKLGGSVTNLSESGLVLSDGTETISVQPNSSSFSFPTQVAASATYNVTIVSQPPGYTEFCTLSNASGSVGNSNITNVTVSCRASTLVAGPLQNPRPFGGTPASVFNSEGIAIDASGTIYVADGGPDVIQKISQAGVMTTLAGGDTQGTTNGTGAAASFVGPFAIAVDASGNAYVADYFANMIRKVTASGVVTTLAGSGNAGNQNDIGTAASFRNPTGVAVDASGNVYVADNNNNVIRKITSSGVVTTFAGSGTSGSTDGAGLAASFNQPYCVAVDRAGTLYVTDLGNSLIRKISPAGVVTTLAGSGSPGTADGVGAAASFNFPMGVAVDGAGYVYVADFGNNSIRMITPQGLVSTVGGRNAFGYFSEVKSVAVDSVGNLYAAEFDYPVPDYSGDVVLRVSSW